MDGCVPELRCSPTSQPADSRELVGIYEHTKHASWLAVERKVPRAGSVQKDFFGSSATSGWLALFSFPALPGSLHSRAGPVNGYQRRCLGATVRPAVASE